jgi:hypothetical protein
MTNLTRFDHDGLELVIDTETGEAFASQAGYVRMSSVAQSTISSRMNTQRDLLIKKAEVLTATGLKPISLIPAKIVFRWLMKDRPVLAETMGEVGATVYLHQLAGFKVSSTAIQPQSSCIPPQLTRSEIIASPVTHLFLLCPLPLHL